jgi:hypothetical protein
MGGEDRPEDKPGHGGADLEGEPIIKSVADLKNPAEDPCSMKLPSFSPDELIGTTFLRDPAEGDGRVLHAKIVHAIKKRDADTKTDLLKFVVEIGDNKYDEIMTYNELCDILEQQNEGEEAGF